ncbi:ANTAR domain-containing response regulator [Gimesia panareensis]|uniref:Putative transcriptional regulatory protein pdtaR n=1 Tax=Gimesia panareensis TaxID=2527978 RepID=A0A518A8M4_9PLAN|nr:response regulator [Gimesia panareensis]QDU51080.1 putative transcriptional regulatory protein pdtaR [Gimesia panareensis]QDV18951.1 putative transcriptional regulatory protein pdtaR [Gimesia panareensis]
MDKVLRIAIADDEPEMLQFLEMALSSMGHEVVVQAKNGQQLIDECLTALPDLIITDINMPDVDGLEAVKQIQGAGLVPVILVSAHHDPEFVQRAIQNYVLAYLVKPIKKKDLEPAISLVVQRFKEFQTLQQEAEDLRHSLADRKLIERAKGILMKLAGLTEPEAFKRLQLLSSQKNMKMAEIAQSIITAEEAF